MKGCMGDVRSVVALNYAPCVEYFARVCKVFLFY